VKNRIAAKALLAVVFACLVGCAASQVMQNPTIKTMPQSTSTPSPDGLQYLYVADRTSDSLLVYPYGEPDASPMRSVSLGDTPSGVATDSQGNVYVALHNDRVLEYSAGAAAQVRALTHADGIVRPSAIMVDASDHLWVANDYTSDAYGVVNTAFIAEYEPGANLPINKIHMDVPNRPDFHISGFAFDSTGQLFIDVWDGPVSLVISKVNGAFESVASGAAPASIAFRPNGILLVAGAFTQVFKQSSTLPWPQIKSIAFGGLRAVGFLTTGSDGTLYVPIWNQSNPGVLIVPASGQPYRVTKGMEWPIAAAPGVASSVSNGLKPSHGVAVGV
jgi:hypothetical protein